MIDGKLILHEAALTVTAAAQAGGNYIDFEVADPNLGKGRAIEIIGINTSKIVIASTGTLKFAIQQSSDNAVADAYADMDGCTKTYSAEATATLTIAEGTELFRFTLPNTHERYIRFCYTPGTVNLKTGGSTTVHLLPRS